MCFNWFLQRVNTQQQTCIYWTLRRRNILIQVSSCHIRTFPLVWNISGLLIILHMCLSVFHGFSRFQNWHEIQTSHSMIWTCGCFVYFVSQFIVTNSAFIRAVCLAVCLALCSGSVQIHMMFIPSAFNQLCYLEVLIFVDSFQAMLLLDDEWCWLVGEWKIRPLFPPQINAWDLACI